MKHFGIQMGCSDHHWSVRCTLSNSSHRTLLPSVPPLPAGTSPGDSTATVHYHRESSHPGLETPVSKALMAPDGESQSGKRWIPARWAVWQLSAQLLFPILTVEVTAIALMGVQAAAGTAAFAENAFHLGLLCVLGVLHTEIAREIEKVRWRIHGDMHVDLISVWIFAGAVLLPPFYAGVVAMIVHTHSWWRSARARTPLYRHVFSTATAVLSCIAAASAMAYMSGGQPVALGGDLDVLVLGLGAMVLLTVNSALVAGAIAVSKPEAKLGEILGDWDENLLEVATLCLGALVAVALTINPWLALFILPPLLVLHRAVLVRYLEEAASTDSKTGLLNAAAWHSQAERELRRAERREGPRAVLVIDLDHFKVVNDTHGHLAGDQVLAAVADSLRAEVRDRDLVGRFGGEEFVVLLGGLQGPGHGSDELAAVAERIRRRIAGLRVEMPTPDGPLTVTGLSASVGGALYPGDGRDLRSLLHVADAALYAAKRAGRNMVRMGLQLPAPVQPMAAERRPDAPAPAP